MLESYATPNPMGMTSEKSMRRGAGINNRGEREYSYIYGGRKNSPGREREYCGNCQPKGAPPPQCIYTRFRVGAITHPPAPFLGGGSVGLR